MGLPWGLGCSCGLSGPLGQAPALPSSSLRSVLLWGRVWGLDERGCKTGRRWGQGCLRAGLRLCQGRGQRRSPAAACLLRDVSSAFQLLPGVEEGPGGGRTGPRKIFR